MIKRTIISMTLLALAAGAHAQNADVNAETEQVPVLVKTLPEPASVVVAITEMAKYEFGQSRLGLIYIERAALAAVGTPEANQIESMLLPVLADEATTPDAKRFICRMLGLVGGQRAADAMAPLLQDPAYSGHALQALEALDGDLAIFVDAALSREAFAGSPELRANIVSALGRRGSPVLPGMAKNMFPAAEPAVHGALADALGKLATPEACGVLADQFFAEGVDRAPLYPGCVPCAPVLAADIATAQRGLDWLRALHAPEAPAYVRGRALVASAALAPYEDETLEAARQALLTLADGDNDIDVVRARMEVLEQSAEGHAELAALAASSDPIIQVLAMDALGRSKDASAVAVLAANLGSENLEVRASAYRAIIASASDEAFDPLFALASSEDSKVSRDAVDALTKLNAPGADARLAAVAATGAPAAQVLALNLLGQRRSFGQREVAMAALASTDASVSAAAHSALRIIAQEENLPTLLDAALAATDEEVGKEYQSTVVALAARLPKENRVALLKSRLDASEDTAQRATLIGLIGRVGGDDAFAVLDAASTNADANIRLAAAKSLAAWGDTVALPPLEKILNADASGEAGKTAYDGMVRLLSDNDVPSKSAMNYVQVLRKAAETDTQRRRLLQAINTVTDLRAFRIAESMVQESGLKSEAEQALVNLGERLAGAYPTEVQARMLQIARTTERENLKNAARNVSNTINRSRNYLTAWAVSGPYEVEGKRANEIYDVRFAPEDGLVCGDSTSTGHKGWEIAPISLAEDKPGYVDLEKEFKANECVAYLRTCFTVTAPVLAKLWLGSDDGCKVWHNGTQRLVSLGMRHYVEGEDSLLILLEPGEHTIVVAVYQHASIWGASVRLTNPEGGPISGLKAIDPLR